MNTATAHVTDRRALLASIRQRKVSAVAKESTPYSAALYGLLYERVCPNGADHAQWNAALAELDASDATIGEWLEAEARR